MLFSIQGNPTGLWWLTLELLTTLESGAHMQNNMKYVFVNLKIADINYYLWNDSFNYWEDEEPVPEWETGHWKQTIMLQKWREQWSQSKILLNPINSIWELSICSALVPHWINEKCLTSTGLFTNFLYLLFSFF